MMLAKSSSALRVAVASSRSFSTSAPAQATLREISGRLKSTRNIEKITASMKMIAASKLNRAQRAMDAAKVYGKANTEFFSNINAANLKDGKTLFVVVSSDKGMCGGIHSSVTKFTKKSMSADQSEDIVILGDKSKAQISRSLPENIKLSFNQLGSSVPTFGDAAAIADLIINSKMNFDQVAIVYNRFVSAISYEADVQYVFNESALRNAPGFPAYEDAEFEDTTAKDLAQFALANAIYATLAESHASEISAKRNAMDNASKNAGEMINSLQIQFNRGRQAAITNELIDIVTGASALAG